MSSTQVGRKIVFCSMASTRYQTKLLLSTPHTRAWLPTFSKRSFWPVPDASSLHLTLKWLITQVALSQKMRRDSSFLDVLALCSHVQNFFGIWLLTSFQHGQWYNLCFSVPSSLFHPRQPMSYHLLCTQPPSTTSFRTTIRCLFVHSALIFLRSKT